MTPGEILELSLDDNDAGANTVRDYLVALVATVWYEDEGFSGKRPFGNSGWRHDLYVPLVKAGLIVGAFDERYGNLRECDRDSGDRLIALAIAALGGAI